MIFLNQDACCGRLKNLMRNRKLNYFYQNSCISSSTMTLDNILFYFILFSKKNGVDEYFLWSYHHLLLKTDLNREGRAKTQIKFLI